MGYPYWQAAKKDGTRDLRTNNTRIVRTPTVIFLGGWRLSVRNPFTAYDFVNDLRDAGHDLGRCPEEQWKLRCLTERERARSEATSIDGIVNRFRDHPTDFEPFCADLFHTLGWRRRPRRRARRRLRSQDDQPGRVRPTSPNASATRHGIMSGVRSSRNCMEPTPSNRRTA